MSDFVVKITANDKGNPPGKLADAEIHFTSGPLDGLKLIGFGIWERRNGGGRNVTFPARQYSVNGERRSFALLRPIVDAEPRGGIGDILRLRAGGAHFVLCLFKNQRDFEPVNEFLRYACVRGDNRVGISEVAANQRLVEVSSVHGAHEVAVGAVHARDDGRCVRQAGSRHRCDHRRVEALGEHSVEVEFLREVA